MYATRQIYLTRLFSLFSMIAGMHIVREREQQRRRQEQEQMLQKLAVNEVEPTVINFSY